jgi:hypothetical protein
LQNYRQDLYEPTLLNIIVFNDNCTVRWSKKNNYLQLKMFYEMCLEFQKKLK